MMIESEREKERERERERERGSGEVSERGEKVHEHAFAAERFRCVCRAVRRGTMLWLTEVIVCGQVEPEHMVYVHGDDEQRGPVTAGGERQRRAVGDVQRQLRLPKSVQEVRKREYGHDQVADGVHEEPACARGGVDWTANEYIDRQQREEAVDEGDGGRGVVLCGSEGVERSERSERKRERRHTYGRWPGPAERRTRPRRAVGGRTRPCADQR